MMVRVSTEGIAAIHNSSFELEVALGFRLRHAPLLLIPGLPGALGVDLSALTFSNVPKNLSASPGRKSDPM